MQIRCYDSQQSLLQILSQKHTSCRLKLAASNFLRGLVEIIDLLSPRTCRAMCLNKLLYVAQQMRPASLLRTHIPVIALVEVAPKHALELTSQDMTDYTRRAAAVEVVK